MKPLVIAIDGPSGAGKGTVARAIASELGYRHVDSGAMYRAVAWKALRDGAALEDEAAVAALAAVTRVDIAGTDVTVDGEAVTRAIRTPEIDRAAAAVRTPAARSQSARRAAASDGRQRRHCDGGTRTSAPSCFHAPT
jgi:cytidylate kinase